MESYTPEWPIVEAIRLARLVMVDANEVRQLTSCSSRSCCPRAGPIHRQDRSGLSSLGWRADCSQVVSRLLSSGELRACARGLAELTASSARSGAGSTVEVKS
jgi:hypothetical protein